MNPASAYLILAYDIVDDTALQAYRETAKPILEAHGAEIFIMAGDFDALEGRAPQSLVALRFPSREQAQAAYHSPEYQATIPQRQAATRNSFAVIL